MPYIRPDAGDIGIVEHYAFPDNFMVVRVEKVTPARLVISVLQKDGSWSKSSSRAIERFMHMPVVSHETLLEIREALVETGRRCRAAIDEAKQTAINEALMMAAQGRAL